MVTYIPRPREASRRRKDDAETQTVRNTSTTSTKSSGNTRFTKHDLKSHDQASRKVVDRSTEASFRSRKHEDVQAGGYQTSSSGGHPDVAPTDNPMQNVQNSYALRRKRSLIGDYVKKQRDLSDHGVDNLSVRIPRDTTSSTGTTVPRTERSSSQTRPSHAMERLPAASARDVPKEPQRTFQALTPLSETSATPSLRDNSPSIFSQVSPSSTATPTSTSGYSPQLIQSPHFGPGPSAIYPQRKLTGQQPAQQPSYTQSAHHVPDPRRIGTTVKGHSIQPRVIRPPELAHLEKAIPAPKTTNSGPPPRPSRDGVEGLISLTPSVPQRIRPQVESNHDRNRPQSSSVDFCDDHTGTNSRPSLSAVDQSRRMSQSQPITSTARTRLSVKPPDKPRLIDTTVSPASAGTPGRSTASPASTTSTKSTSRFGFFHRRERLASPVAEVDTAAVIRKGPTAGTGHEGYARHGNKRQSSGSVPANRASSGSTSSQNNDEFLSRKAAPVYLRKDADGHVVQSDRSSGGFGGNSDPRMSSAWSELSQSSEQPSLNATHVPSALTDDTSGGRPQELYSPGSLSRGRDMSSTSLASRPRKLSKEAKRGVTPERQPTPFSGGPAMHVPTLVPRPKEKKSDAIRSFFGFGASRAKPVPNYVKEAASKPSKTSRTAAKTPASAIPIASTAKRMAHYEILDASENEASSSGQVPMEDIGQMLAEAVLIDNETQPEAGGQAQAETSKQASLSATKPNVEFADVGLTLSPELQQQHSARPTDHRITAGPRGSDLEHKQSMPKTSQHRRSLSAGSHVPSNQQSFSRPFGSVPKPNVSNLTQDTPAIADEAQQHYSRKPSLTMGSERRQPSLHKVSQISSSREEARHFQPYTTQPPAGFFMMQQRKNSDLSVSSSSGSFWFSTPAETALVPAAGAPSSPDEVWQEYDTLIERVLTPSDESRSSSMDKPRDYFARGQAKGSVEGRNDKVKSITTIPKLAEMAASLRPDLSPFMGTEKRSPYFGGLQHPALRSPTPSPPDRPLPELPILLERTKPQSTRDEPKLIRRSSTKKKPQNHAPLNGQSKPLDLRVAAVNVSKWLTGFDQLLVSPAHEELEAFNGERVLVIDGLGKEWSVFCAQHYPKAQVVGLSPAPYDKGPIASASRQSNHRHVRYSNLSVSFPFPPNYFHTVVFRFPVATSEYKLGSAISECKRVLRPGGYLEISVLDMDLTVMGQFTRKAIKDLKIMLQSTEPDVSLKPTSDYVQYLLGRYGLEDLHRCTLGPPVAGVVPGSQNGSLEKAPKHGKMNKYLTREAQKARQLSSMTSEVARWWYTQTYEQRMLDKEGYTSIWNDQKLLNECEEKGASFKLLLCWAQKPALNKRKTQSL